MWLQQMLLQKPNRHQRTQQMRLNAARRILLCGSESAAELRCFKSSNLAGPESKLLRMPPTLRLRPALESAAPEKAEVIVVVQSLLRRAGNAEANSAGSRYAEHAGDVC